MSRSLYRKALIKAFQQKSKPTMFLASFFQTPPENIRKSMSLDIDIRRHGRKVAVDIQPGTGGRFVKSRTFTNKEYYPPEYNLYSMLNPESLQTREFGMTEDAGRAYALQAINIVTNDMVEIQDQIQRAIEKQAADALINGQITLVNGDVIGFEKKATHDYDVTSDGSGAWNVAATGKPLTDLENGCKLIRIDGALDSNVFNLITSEDVIASFLDNDQVTERANLRRIDNVDIAMPNINTAGAVYHGQVSAGSYRVNLWSYPSYYEIPVGFGFANEGTTTPYIPAGKAILLGEGVRFDKVFAGIPLLVAPNDPDMSAFFGAMAPTVQAGEFVPYMRPDINRESILYGVRSKPLCIPTQIDGFVTYTKING